MKKPKNLDLKQSLKKGGKLMKSGKYPEALDIFKHCWQESWSGNKNEKADCRGKIISLSIILTSVPDREDGNKKIPLPSELFLNFFDDLLKENPKDELLWKGKVRILESAQSQIGLAMSFVSGNEEHKKRIARYEKPSEEIMKTYEEGLKFLPKSHFLLEGMANSLDYVIDYEKAIEYYKKAIESKPTCLSCIYELYTTLFFHVKNPTEALKYIEMWLKVQSSGSKREDIIDLKEAELIKNAKKESFSRTMLYECLHDSFEEGKNYWRNKLETMYFKGMALMNLHRYDEAIDVFEKIVENFKRLEQDDDHIGFVLRQKGKAFIGLKKYKEALSCFDNSLKAWTDSDLKDPKKVISDFFENISDEIFVVEDFMNRIDGGVAEYWFEKFMLDRVFVLRELGMSKEAEEYKRALNEWVKERKISDITKDLRMIIKESCIKSKENGGEGVAQRNDIINAAEEAGMPRGKIKWALNRLLGERGIYEPKRGGGYRITPE